MPVVTPEQRDAALVQQATAFVAEADAQLRRAMVAASQAEWDEETDGTDAHKAAAAAANAEQSRTIAALMVRARKFEPVLAKLDPLARRQLQVLVDMLPVMAAVQPAPDDAAQAAELAKIAEDMGSVYRQGPVCPPGDKDPKHCKNLEQLSTILQTSRKPAELLAAWQGWHDAVGRAERDLFVQVRRARERGREGDRLHGRRRALASRLRHAARTRSSAEIDRLWDQVKPLYDAAALLRAPQAQREVRRQGRAEDRPDPGAPARQHVGADVGATSIPSSSRTRASRRSTSRRRSTKSYDADEDGEDGRGVLHLARHRLRCRRRSGSARCSTKPAGQDVVCHASAWDVTYNDDLRIKMCIEPERGGSDHDPPRARPRLLLPRTTTSCRSCFQQGANDGFHEAIGDTIALSMTPAYLKEIGLLDKVDEQREGDDQPADEGRARQGRVPAVRPADRQVALGRVLRQGHAGRSTTQHWWELRREVPGRRAAGARAARPTSIRARSIHVAANTPYMRYFLARDPPVPVPPRAVQGGRLHRAAQRVLDLRQQGRGRRVPDDARARREQAVAGRARRS